MRSKFATSAAILAAMITGPALAQDSVERYQLERTDDGYVRLDTTTGRVTLCQENNGQLVCRMAAEERAAYDRDLDSLQERIDTLEARITALESGRPAAELPNDEEFEQTLGYMEKFFRRFMGIVKDFESETNTEPAVPDRT